MNRVHQIGGTPVARQRGQHRVQVAADILISVGQVFNLLRSRTRVAAHLCIDLIQIIALEIVVALLYPVNFAKKIGAAVLRRVASAVSQGGIRHGDEQFIVLRPVV